MWGYNDYTIVKISFFIPKNQGLKTYNCKYSTKKLQKNTIYVVTITSRKAYQEKSQLPFSKTW